MVKGRVSSRVGSTRVPTGLVGFPVLNRWRDCKFELDLKGNGKKKIKCATVLGLDGRVGSRVRSGAPVHRFERVGFARVWSVLIG